jgi:hypothetical protein
MAGFVDVIFRVNNAAVETGFAKVRQNAAQLKSDLVSQFAGAFALGSIVATLKSVADEFGRVRDLSDRFGVSAESIQRVGFAAKQAGADIEIVARGMAKATQNAAAAVDPSSAMGAAFAELGINAAEFVNLPMEDKLVVLSGAFNGVTGDGDKLRLAIQVLGKSGADLLPLLKQGPDALRESMAAASVATQEQIEKMDDLSDRLEAAGQSVRVGIGGAFVWLSERIEDAGSYIGAFIDLALQKVGKLNEGFDKIKKGDIVGAYSSVLQANSFDIKGGVGAMQIANSEIAARIAEREAAKTRIKTPSTSSAEAGTGGGKPKDAITYTGNISSSPEELKALQAKEKELIDLRATVAKQEFEKLSKEEQLLILANEANQLAANRGEPELETLKRKEELNNVSLEILKIQKSLDTDKSRAAKEVDRKTKADFKDRGDALGFASGAKATSLDAGLLGVNAKVGNVEAEKQIKLQIEMAAYLKTIAEKEFSVEIPEAE